MLNLRAGAGFFAKLSSRFFFLVLAFSLASCSLFKTRPTQEMSDTNAAIKAAKEVQADVLAPDLYRQANDWWRRARKEYRFKNFQLAEDYAKKARHLAEQAEFEVIKNGGQRQEPPVEPTPTATEPYAYPTPTGTPIERYPVTGTTPAPSP